MAAAADDPPPPATDLAEFLVRAGMPFRDAHAVVGDLVRRSLDDGDDAGRPGRRRPRLGPDAAALLEPGVAVTMRTTRGGGGPAAFAVQREAFATPAGARTDARR